MAKSTMIACAIAALLLLAAPTTQAAPCLIVTITGAQAGPGAYQGLAGPGTLIRYGDAADNCSAVRLQFDAGCGTLLRFSQLDVLSSQLNATFFSWEREPGLLTGKNRVAFLDEFLQFRRRL